MGCAHLMCSIFLMEVFVGTDEEKEHFIDVVIDKSTFVKELKQDSGFVYVAFLAENQPTNFTITVYTPNGIYTKSATKDFQLGSDYRTNLTMNKNQTETLCRGEWREMGDRKLYTICQSN